MLKFVFPVFACLALVSCSPTETPKLPTIEVLGRSDSSTLSSRTPIYRMQIPEGWDFTFPPIDAPLIDTTEPLLTLTKNSVTVTFHNFPAQNVNDRIPPISQVARWKNQFTEIDDTAIHTSSFAVAGFIGFQFDGTGMQNGKETTVKAWILQLTPELFQRLPYEATQQKADWTLKAVGSPENIQLLEPELLNIARSVELLQEIPSR